MNDMFKFIRKKYNKKIFETLREFHTSKKFGPPALNEVNTIHLLLADLDFTADSILTWKNINNYFWSYPKVAWRIWNA